MILLSIVSESETRIVDPIPSRSRGTSAAVFLATPAMRGPASVYAKMQGKIMPRGKAPHPPRSSRRTSDIFMRLLRRGNRDRRRPRFRVRLLSTIAPTYPRNRGDPQEGSPHLRLCESGHPGVPLPCLAPATSATSPGGADVARVHPYLGDRESSTEGQAPIEVDIRHEGQDASDREAPSASAPAMSGRRPRIYRTQFP